MAWSEKFPATQFRIARPTNNLGKTVRFYNEGLGLPVISSFHDHDGFDGVMLGLPGFDYHLELVYNHRNPNLPPVDAENMLVFYFEDEPTVLNLRAKLLGMGYKEVRTPNPYWHENAIVFEDPDGWRVALYEGPGISRVSLE